MACYGPYRRDIRDAVNERLKVQKRIQYHERKINLHAGRITDLLVALAAADKRLTDIKALASGPETLTTNYIN